MTVLEGIIGSFERSICLCVDEENKCVKKQSKKFARSSESLYDEFRFINSREKVEIKQNLREF